jgi:serine/threonine protein kinase
MDSTLSPVSHQNATRVRKISWHELHKIRFLCHGSGTAIYSANLAASHETSADVPVVLKTARCGLSGNDLSNVRAELKHEAECLSQLDHPNIIKMYGWGTIPSSATVCAVDTAFIDTPIPWSEFFLVLEPLVGGILSDRLQTNIANNGHGVQSNYRQPPPPPGPYVQRLFADVSPKSVAAFPKVDSEELFGPPSPPSSRIGTKPLTYIEVLIFAEQLAGALHYMHAQVDSSSIRGCLLLVLSSTELYGNLF